MNWKQCVAGVVLVGVQSVFAQGSLTPPGAPAPTMKTLDQVEPRTPISSVPYTISEPGSYYLTTNLTAPNAAITIRTNNVTLDLNGYTVASASEVYTVIFIDGSEGNQLSNIAIRNGSIVGGFDGVKTEYVVGSEFDNLRIFNTASAGIYLYADSHGITIRRCLIGNIGGAGIHMPGVNGCTMNRILDTVIGGCGTYGIYIQGTADDSGWHEIRNCQIGGCANSGILVVSTGTGKTCNNNIIENCSSSGNELGGISLGGSSGGACDANRIVDCTFNDNVSYGIRLYGDTGQCNANTILRCSAIDNTGSGILLSGNNGLVNGNTMVECEVIRNGSYGILLWAPSGACNGNVIRACKIRENEWRGLYLYGYSGACDDNLIENCSIVKNNEIGIFLGDASGCRVENNHIGSQISTNDTYGIKSLEGAGNFIFGNTAVGNTNNFYLSATDLYGPILTGTGALSDTGARANYSK